MLLVQFSLWRIQHITGSNRLLFLPERQEWLNDARYALLHPSLVARESLVVCAKWQTNGVSPRSWIRSEAKRCVFPPLVSLSLSSSCKKGPLWQCTFPCHIHTTVPQTCNHDPDKVGLQRLSGDASILTLKIFLSLRSGPWVQCMRVFDKFHQQPLAMHCTVGFLQIWHMAADKSLPDSVTYSLYNFLQYNSEIPLGFFSQTLCNDQFNSVGWLNTS